MRKARLIAIVVASFAAFALQSGAVRAETAPRLDISILSMGSWRAGDFLRVRVTAPVADPTQIRGRPVALEINGVAVGSQPLAGRLPDGAAYADFAVPWQGQVQTTLAAALVDTPFDAATPDTDSTLIVQPD